MLKLTKRMTIVLVVTILSAGMAVAETRMAIMNYQAVLFSSSAAQEATEVLRQSLSGQQAQLKQLQQGMESRQSRLKTDAEILTPEESLVFQREIQAMAVEQSRLSNQMQQAQQKSRNEFVAQYQPLVRDIVQVYVKEKDYDLILDAQAVLVNIEVPDITQIILEKFDAKYDEMKSK